MMNVKIDTKEKFHVINILEPELTANMTEEMEKLFTGIGQNETQNIILNLEHVSSVTPEMALFILNAQQKSYENNHSFVVCHVPKKVEEWLDKEEYLELMNITPTESEAWDIIQMEEIERELFD